MGLTMFGIAPVCLAGLLTAPSALALGPPVAPATGEQLYEEGEHAYFIGDFDTAVSKFEAAYRVSKLAAVLYNIALAYLRRYEVSGEPKDLRRARAVLENFGLELARNPNLANAENVRTLSAKIDEALAKHPTVPVPSAPAEQAELSFFEGHLDPLGPAIGVFGLDHALLPAEQLGQVVQASGGVGVLRAQYLLPDRQRLAQERLGA